MSSRVDPRHDSDHDAQQQPLALMNQPAQSDAPPLNTVLGEMAASTNLLKGPVLNEPLPKESLLPVQFEQLEPAHRNKLEKFLIGHQIRTRRFNVRDELKKGYQ